jgi:hypothetical protein
MSRYEVGVVEASEGSASIGLWCDTCGTRFPTEGALAAHLVYAYHGFQCLRCGALFALRRQMEDHDCHESSEAG